LLFTIRFLEKDIAKISPFCYNESKGGDIMKRTVLHTYRADGVHFSRKVTEEPVDNAPTAHIWWEMILVKGGDVVYMVNGKEYHPRKNSLIITRPLDYHSVSFNSAENYDRYLIVFPENAMISDVCSRMPQDLDVLDLNGNEQVLGLFRKMCSYIEQFDSQTVRILLTYMIEEILYNAIQMAQKAKEAGVRSVNPTINRALQYINENITRQFSLDELADHLHLTKGHVRRLFVSHMNTTPKQFILSQKLLLARRDLCAGSNATEVSAKYGFADYSGFYRHYLHHYGHKPSDAMEAASFVDDGF